MTNHCPICGVTLAENAFDGPDFPFCTKRCKTIDLYRWCNGQYQVVEDQSELPTIGLDPETLAELMANNGFPDELPNE